MILPERLRGDIVNDELAEAERIVRALHYGSAVMSPEFEALAVYGAEFDRLRLVEQAATALVDDYERRLQVTINGKVQVDKHAIDALAAAVRGETP